MDSDVDLPNAQIVEVSPDVTEHTIDLGPGEWCFRATHTNNAGLESNVSNLALKSIIPPPQPPSNLTVSDEIVYSIIKQENRFVLIPVGTAPVGSNCDPDQSVNGHNVVARNMVTWASGVQPLVVVAKCVGG